MILHNNGLALRVLLIVLRFLPIPIAVEAARVGDRCDLVSRVYFYNPLASKHLDPWTQKHLPNPLYYTYWAFRHGTWDAGFGLWPGASPGRFGVYTGQFDGINFVTIRFGIGWISVDF